MAVTVTGCQGQPTERNGTAAQPIPLSETVSFRVVCRRRRRRRRPVPVPVPSLRCGAVLVLSSQLSSSTGLPSPFLGGRSATPDLSTSLFQFQAEAGLQEAAPRRKRHADAGASGVLVILLRQT